MNTNRLLVAGTLVCACAATLAAAGSAKQTETKQRVAIIERVTGQGAGTFQVIPLTSGPLKPDSGKASHNGAPLGPIMREGQRLKRASGTDELKGKLGSFRITRAIEIAEVGGGFSTYGGTWSLDIYVAKRQYRGFAGGGRLAAVEFRDGRAIVRQEGFLTKS
jgi:hypothetical protein